MTKLNTAILGASGYTGAELIRFLLNHPNVKLTALTGESQAGQKIGDVYPHLASYGLPDLIKINEVDFSDIELVFCCLPHGTTQEIIAGLPEHIRIVDLSADFRLYNVADYARWYGHAHLAPALQKEAVYGLTEHYRDDIKKARLVANPGCYPTSTLLPLLPLMDANIISKDNIIIDAKSGVTGAGRVEKRAFGFSEISEGMSAYGVCNHRHMAEMEQELSVGGADVQVTFTPHLIPMKRGMITTIYATLSNGITLAGARSELTKYYADEAFVQVLTDGKAPATHHVRGSNQCHIGLFAGRKENQIILVSAIDNLVKGASGQAIQNMNVMFGFDEALGLELSPMFP